MSAKAVSFKTPRETSPVLGLYFPSNCQQINIQLLAVLNLYRSLAAMRVKASNSKPKAAPAVETSESINAQIAAFLKTGGEIQQIAKGVD